MINPQHRFQLIRAARRYQAIKQYYLNSGGTEQDWQGISQDPRKFNVVWRCLLQLPESTQPPPEIYRE